MRETDEVGEMDGVGERGQMAAMIAAIDRSNAIIEFTAAGEILKANDRFLHCLGYRRDGKNASATVTAGDAARVMMFSSDGDFEFEFGAGMT